MPSLDEMQKMADKQAALLEMVLAVYDRCRALVDAGVAPSDIEATDFSALTRVRDDAGPGDGTRVRALQDEVLQALGSLA